MEKINAIEPGIAIVGILISITIYSLKLLYDTKFNLIISFLNKIKFKTDTNSFKLSHLISKDSHKILSYYFYRIKIMKAILYLILPFISLATIISILFWLIQSTKDNYIDKYDFKLIVLATFLSSVLQGILIFYIKQGIAFYEEVKEESVE